jgi:hypothetical protein
MAVLVEKRKRMPKCRAEKRGKRTIFGQTASQEEYQHDDVAVLGPILRTEHKENMDSAKN